MIVHSNYDTVGRCACVLFPVRTVMVISPTLDGAPAKCSHRLIDRVFCFPPARQPKRQALCSALPMRLMATEYDHLLTCPFADCCGGAEKGCGGGAGAVF